MTKSKKQFLLAMCLFIIMMSTWVLGILVSNTIAAKAATRANIFAGKTVVGGSEKILDEVNDGIITNDGVTPAWTDGTELACNIKSGVFTVDLENLYDIKTFFINHKFDHVQKYFDVYSSRNGNDWVLLCNSAQMTKGGTPKKCANSWCTTCKEGSHTEYEFTYDFTNSTLARYIKVQFNAPWVWSGQYGLAIIEAGAYGDLVSPSLDVPQNVVATTTENSIQLKWDAVNNATSYDILKSSSSGEKTLIKTTQSLSFVDKDIYFNQEYSYFIRAISDNSESSLSVSAKATLQTDKYKTNIAPSADIFASSIAGSPTFSVDKMTNGDVNDKGWKGATLNENIIIDLKGSYDIASIRLDVSNIGISGEYKVFTADDEYNWLFVAGSKLTIDNIIDGVTKPFIFPSVATPVLEFKFLPKDFISCRYLKIEFIGGALPIVKELTIKAEQVSTLANTLAHPENVSISNINAFDVTLNWNAVPNATSYKIYSDLDNYRDAIGEVSSNLYKITGLKMEEKYSFRVVAVNQLSTSPRSEIVSAQTVKDSSYTKIDYDFVNTSHNSDNKSKINDGNNLTQWDVRGISEGTNVVIQIDLFGNYQITELLLRSQKGFVSQQYEVQFSNDGSEWTTKLDKQDMKVQPTYVYYVPENGQSLPNGKYTCTQELSTYGNFKFSPTNTYRYVKLTISKHLWNQYIGSVFNTMITELEIYGKYISELDPELNLLPVKNLQPISVRKNSIKFKWDAAVGATSYDIYRADMGFDKPLTNVTTCEYLDKNLFINTKYEYKVKAVKNQERSLFSNSFVQTTTNNGYNNIITSNTTVTSNLMDTANLIDSSFDTFAYSKDSTITNAEIVIDLQKSYELNQILIDFNPNAQAFQYHIFGSNNKASKGEQIGSFGSKFSNIDGQVIVKISNLNGFRYITIQLDNFSVDNGVKINEIGLLGKEFTGSIVDTDSPVVYVDWNLNDAYLKGDSITLPQATAIDVIDGTLQADCFVTTPGGQKTKLTQYGYTLQEIGVYTFTYVGTDASGNKDEIVKYIASQSVLSAPEFVPFTPIIGSYNMSLGALKFPLVSTVSDSKINLMLKYKDSDFIKMSNGSQISNLEIGEYSYYYEAINSNSEKTTTIVYKLNVVDDITPTITAVNTIVNIGETIKINKFDVRAIDNGHIDLTKKIVIKKVTFNGKDVTITSNSFVATSIGVYKITLYVTDGANASEIEWQIEAQDKIKPVITVKNIPTRFLFGSTYLLPTAYAIDNIDPVVSVTVKVIYNNAEFPIENNQIVFSKYGKYQIIYSAIDSNNNVADLICETYVIDNDLPMFDLSSINKSGMVGEFFDLNSVKAIDNDAILGLEFFVQDSNGYKVVVKDNKFEFTQAGTYLVSCTATDLSGNNFSAIFSVNVSAPVKSGCNSNIFSSTNSVMLLICFMAVGLVCFTKKREVK